MVMKGVQKENYFVEFFLAFWIDFSKIRLKFGAIQKNGNLYFPYYIIVVLLSFFLLPILRGHHLILQQFTSKHLLTNSVPLRSGCLSLCILFTKGEAMFSKTLLPVCPMPPPGRLQILN